MILHIHDNKKNQEGYEDSKINDFQGENKAYEKKIRGKAKVKVLIIMTYHEKF